MFGASTKQNEMLGAQTIGNARVPRDQWRYLHAFNDFRGGYILIPKSMEFWEWEKDEMHRRIRFKKQKNGENDWVCERLAP